MQRKIEEGKSVIESVRYGQMCRKYTPKGKMGYPKVQKGISQKVFWGIRELGNKRIFIRRADKMEGRLGSLHFCKFAKLQKIFGYRR